MLLSACRKWGNVALGRYAFDEAVQLDEGDDAAYLCMFNIYSDADMDDEAKYIERLRLMYKTTYLTKGVVMLGRCGGKANVII